MESATYSRRTFKSLGHLSGQNGRSIKCENTWDCSENLVKTGPTRLSDDEIDLLIPTFNPATTTGLSAAEWIATIVNLRMLFDWNDRLTLLYASRRLEGDAKRWFAQNFCKWPQFKVSLQKMFPQAINNAQVFEELICRSKNNAESYEKYAFDVERMAMKCGFDLETTINYMISGLRNSALRTHLVACNCKTITELLYRIQCYNEYHNLKAAADRFRQKSESEGGRKRSSETEGGPQVKRAPSDTDQNIHRDLMTTVKVKEAYLTAFVSLDSDCTTMKHSEFKRHDLKMNQCDDTVHTSDSGPVRAIGCLSEVVTAGEVMMLTKVFVVEDWDQAHPMILGRNFLNSPKVCVFKSYRSLEIRYNPSAQDDYPAETEGALKEEEEDEQEEKKLLELLDFIEGDL